eukprot:6393034-Prymnesium_polylepis.1
MALAVAVLREAEVARVAVGANSRFLAPEALAKVDRTGAQEGHSAAAPAEPAGPEDATAAAET